MNYLKRIRRPEIWMELLGVLLLVLWMAVLPHVHLYCLHYSNQLSMQVTEGKLGITNHNKNGQTLRIGDQFFTCAFDTIGVNTCYHHANTGKTGGLPADLVGKNAVVQWTEVEAFPWQRLRVVIDLVIDGKIYRTETDFDRELSGSKKLAMQSDIFILLLYLVYVWFRLCFRPRLYRQ